MKKGFTLAECLIVLVIIGVGFALTIPTVINNSQQEEYKTGFKKAIAALNSAISLGISQEGISPYDLSEDYTLFNYLAKHMSVLKSTTDLSGYYFTKNSINNFEYTKNKAFYTFDGIRYEFFANEPKVLNHKLYESDTYLNTCYEHNSCIPKDNKNGVFTGFNCGSYGLSTNSDKTIKTPCLITVDVNGDKKPNPSNANCKNFECIESYKYANPKGTKLTDLFSIMITDKAAIPYGAAAQKAMYSSK